MIRGADDTLLDLLEVRLLGGFSIHAGREPMPPLPSRAARLLLAQLILHPGEPQPRSVLADMFWPDVPEARGRRRLSHALWQLQDALSEVCPGQTFVRSTTDAVSFDSSGPYWLDVEEFEQRLDRFDASGRHDRSGERDLRRCVDLYRGDLLAGHYEPWITAEQQRLEQRYLTALSHLVEVCRTQGNFHDALTFAKRITHQDPLREDTHREVMRLCVLLDQPSQALEQYERCRSVLAEELGTEPAAETVALYEKVAAARNHVAPPPSRPRQLISDHLVGRQRPRTQLVDLLERSLAGRSSVALVEGPPGVGKSQLLLQVADDATWRGFTVLWGDCHEAAAPTAYQPVRDALEPALHPVRVAQLRHVLDPIWVGQAARVLRPLADGREAEEDETSPSTERAEAVREGLCQVLVELGRQEPVLLVVDDVQWADPETLALLTHLSRRTDAGRVLVLLGFRDQEARADEQVWAGLRMLDRSAMPQRVALEPLSAFEVGELVAEVLDLVSVPPRFTAALHRESGGNPLYVLELLRALRDGGTLTAGTLDRLETMEVPVTSGLRAVVAQRLGTLSPAVTSVVELAAVLGSDFSLPVLVAAGEVSDHDIARAMTSLTDANVLEPADDGFRFTHAVTRRVILEAIASSRLRQLHRQAANGLEACAIDSPEALAGHLLAAGDHRRAVPHLQRAADRALRVGAYATADQHLVQAIDAIREGPSAIDTRHRLLARREQILDVLGRRDEQAATLDELAQLAEGRVEREIDVGLRRALLLGHLDRFDEAIRLATATAERAVPVSDAEHARVMAVLGQLQSWAGHNVEAVETLAEVTAASTDGWTAANARFALGTALRFIQRYDEAEVELRLALDLAERNDDQAGAVRARGALADLLTESGAWEQALAAYDETIEAARRLGYRQREAVGLVNLGNLHQSRGQPHQALQCYLAAEQTFAELDSRRGVAMVRLNRSWLRHRWLGADDDARSDAEEALAQFTATGNDASGALCLETLAAIERRQGRRRRSRDLLRRALDQAARADENRALAQVHRGLAATAREDGHQDAALTHVQAAIDLATRYGMHDLKPELRAQLAQLHAERGEPDRAWSEATRALEGLDYALEPHRVLHAAAQVADRTGQPALAGRYIREAYDRLLRAVSEFGDDQRERSLTVVRAHRDIVDAARSALPRVASHRFARASAPRGRALSDDEYVTVPLDLGPVPDDAARRREQVRAVIEQVRASDAVPTVADLAEVFDVSASTIHRDLRALRSEGVEAHTRGTGVG